MYGGGGVSEKNKICGGASAKEIKCGGGRSVKFSSPPPPPEDFKWNSPIMYEFVISDRSWMGATNFVFMLPVGFWSMINCVILANPKPKHFE